MNALFSALGRRLARYLTHPLPGERIATVAPSLLAHTLQPGDVLLVEGNSRISTAIKYLTQSTWSHAALYVGPQPQWPRRHGHVVALIEADLNEGVRAMPLSHYSTLHTRICRPVGLTQEEHQQLIAFVHARIGQRYDLKNVFDLARYLLRTPPVPLRLRRRMIALGSGDPTRAICSTLIAQAFQALRYPILPDFEHQPSADPNCHLCKDELLHIQHHSLFTPRDFDVSPFFAVIKPRLEAGFDPHAVRWAEESAHPRSRHEP